jgi:CHAD domain-containing protein
MVGTQAEVERAFAPGPDTDLPDLTGVSGVVAVETGATDELDATYYDVPGLPLLRSGVTLRRRTGGSDEGWHLKLPGNGLDSRTELHEGLDSAGVPDALSGLVAGWTRGRELAPVARIRTDRHTSRLVGADGTVLAEVADDRVEGRPAQLDGKPVRWREWEVELVHGEPSLLDGIERLLAAHGVPRSPQQRKLAVVVGEPDAPRPPKRASRTKPAKRLVHRWILDQVGAIARLDPLVRQAEEGGVHGMRKACRRLRAALATYRPLLDRDRTDPVREELRWLARSLGPARDDEVVVARIDRLLRAEASDVGSAHRALERHAVERAHHDQSVLGETLGSQRYAELRTALDELAADPPWTAEADRPAGKVLPALVRKEWKRLRRRHRRGADPHEVRKAAKRLRYAYELVEPVWGKEAKRPRQAASELTRVLGERQDTLVSREWLAALAGGGTSGGAAFALGRVHALEERHEAELLDEAESRWQDLKSVRW